MVTLHCLVNYVGYVRRRFCEIPCNFLEWRGRVCRVQKLEPFGVTEMCEVRREDLGEKLEEVEE